VLAAAGLTTVAVEARIRVAIITTGSELIEPGTTPALGQVFDSNGTALEAAVETAGAVVASRTHVTDETASMLEALSTADADLILTSGGISMGDYEVVRETLEPLGAVVTTIAMQPGGPQATATFEGVPVICFPGNPVSTQLSFEIFVAPLLRAAAGLPAAVRAPRTLVGAVRSVEGKRQFLRGKSLEGGRVEVVSGASSHLVAGLAASDVLIDVPLEVTSLEAGSTVETWEL
jgi:molybdopterin molybdotransferase